MLRLGFFMTNETKPYTTLSVTSGMPRLPLIRHSSLVLLLEELFCGFTMGTGERSGCKITIQAAQTVGVMKWMGKAGKTTGF